MGILVDNQIIKLANSGGIVPFDYKSINPASIDLKWSGRRKVASQDFDNPGTSYWRDFDDPSVPFVKDNIYIIDTVEYVKIPEDLAGFLVFKSSTGRMGFIQAHVGFFDPGFEGTCTLEIFTMFPTPILLSPGRPIAQLVLFTLDSIPSSRYSGRYQRQSVPQEMIPLPIEQS